MFEFRSERLTGSAPTPAFLPGSASLNQPKSSDVGGVEVVNFVAEAAIKTRVAS
jgi:hypothetical protein